MNQFRISADVGGTFTDIFVMNETTGEVRIDKVPSTPSDPSIAIVKGIMQAGVPFEQLRFFSHGTTVGTNALITRSFPNAALVTTKGFRDILEIRDSTKSHLWDTYLDMPTAYIRRRDRFELAERVAFDGSVVEALNEAEVRELARVLRRRQVQTIAVCLMHSYANPEHENQVAAIFAEELPGVHVTLSTRVLPEISEFPRVSTTVANAVLAPVISQYMANLTQSLRDGGFEKSVLVLHSGGGVVTADSAGEFAARLAASGLAGGALAMEHISKSCGFQNAIGLDVGGTSSDISVMYNGELRVTQDLFVEPGYPIRFPAIDLLTIGAGGGSISWIDEGGGLRNGPQSAGAAPGPACYRTGGTLVTNTDAQVTLGRLGGKLIGGSMTLDRDAAVEAIETHVAGPLGMDVHAAASAAIAVADANMANAVRLVSIQKGYNPDDFVLVGFGGAGPLHAVAVARELSIPKVLIPLYPGITSAMGCALVDIRHDITRTVIVDADAEGFAEALKVINEGEVHLREQLALEFVPEERMQFRTYVSVRYLGQFRALEVPLTVEDGLEGLLQQFHSEHLRQYNYSQPEKMVEIIGVRMAGIGLLDKPELPLLPQAEGEAPVKETRQVYFAQAGGFVETAIYERAKLHSGHVISGPAIIEQFDSTVVLPPGCAGEVQRHGHLIISVG
jgi:N-methylhydantoinase A